MPTVTQKPDRTSVFAQYTLLADDRDTLRAKLNEAGIRTHVRKADHYSANILAPLGLEASVRVSVCHYNSRDEVKKMLSVLNSL